jgi:hypothetical protein
MNGGMYRTRQRSRFVGHLVLAMLCVALTAQPSAQRSLRPPPEALAAAPAELIDRLRADPFTYFRFINRAWTARVCEAFADVTDAPMVRLHGDAHVEQFAFTENAWGLGDFDDSTRGRTYIDIVRFLGSIDLATRQRGWTGDREKLWDRFLEGYRLGLSNPDYRPREPDIVRQLRRQAPMTRAAYLAWGESLMQPMDEATSKSVTQGMEEFDRLVRRERPQLAAGYFAVVRTGWLRIGIGSAATTKVLIRVQGPTTAPGDDVLIEIKEVANLGGLGCLEASGTPQAVRVINGTRQIGRLKHDILAIGPTMLIPAAAGRAEHWLDWWVASWEPSYREVRLSDLRSVRDLSDISFDSGVQLGANKTPAVRERALSSVMKYEPRLRKETSTIVEELLAGWEELARR